MEISRIRKLHTRRHRSRCIWAGGSQFRSRKTTSGLVDRQPLPVSWKPQILTSELSDQQSESLCKSIDFTMTAVYHSRRLCLHEYTLQQDYNDHQPALGFPSPTSMCRVLSAAILPTRRLSGVHSTSGSRRVGTTHVTAY